MSEGKEEDGLRANDLEVERESVFLESVLEFDK